MQRFSAAALIVLAVSGSAHAEQGHVLHGLFCNTESQLDDTLAHMQRGLTPQAAAELTNEAAVVCVFADEVQYMIVGPLVLDEIPGGVLLTKYQGTLVGVLVGDNIRPVHPRSGYSLFRRIGLRELWCQSMCR